jgi:hypothetical protein
MHFVLGPLWVNRVGFEVGQLLPVYPLRIPMISPRHSDFKSPGIPI